MTHARPIHAPTVGLISAALHAGLAVVFVPVLSFLFLVATGGNTVTETGISDTWMTLAVLAPVLSGVIGLISGLAMAGIFNLFVKQQIKAKYVGAPGSRLAAVSVGDAA